MSSGPSAALANTNILMIRHAEKPASGAGLSPAGQARAEAYVDYFRTFTLKGVGPVKIAAVFASAESIESDRPALTVAPTAAALGLTVDTRFKDKHYQKLVDHLKSEATNAGADLLICWHHGEILALAGALGVDPSALPASATWPGGWPGDVFGWLLQLCYDEDGAIIPGKTLCLDEDLMPGDSQLPPPGPSGGPPEAAPGDPPSA